MEILILDWLDCTAHTTLTYLSPFLAIVSNSPPYVHKANIGFPFRLLIFRSSSAPAATFFHLDHPSISLRFNSLPRYTSKCELVFLLPFYVMRTLVYLILLRASFPTLPHFILVQISFIFPLNVKKKSPFPTVSFIFLKSLKNCDFTILLQFS